MAEKFPKVSIVVATLNNKNVLRRALHAMVEQRYPNDYEIIVVNDGSSDGTAEMLQRDFGSTEKISIINFEKNKGVCKARNAGIKKARYPIIVNMDHDCIPEKEWLRDLVATFKDPKVGVVSSFGSFGGTSTAFRKELLEKAGGYDERYKYFREDTDLTFTIMEMGYKYKKVKANYLHEHKETAPKGFFNGLRYALKRLRYHQNDVLLFKKHPLLAGKMLGVRFGFFISPLTDLKIVINKWEGSDKQLKLGSPRGITFIENKGPLHALLIIVLGILYVVALKAFRLWGSIKFRKLLI